MPGVHGARPDIGGDGRRHRVRLDPVDCNGCIPTCDGAGLAGAIGRSGEHHREREHVLVHPALGARHELRRVHHRSDALSSVGALAGIGGAMLGWGVCDPLASIVICLIIFKVAFEVLRDAVDKVTDTPCAPTFELEVRDCILAQDGVLRIDALRTRKFGNKVYVDAEIAVDGQLRLVDAHAIAERAHDAVEQRFPTVKHIMIHENPA